MLWKICTTRYETCPSIGIKKTPFWRWKIKTEKHRYFWQREKNAIEPMKWFLEHLDPEDYIFSTSISDNENNNIFHILAKNNSLQTLNLLPEFIDTNIYVYKNLWETHCEIDPDYFYDEIMHGKNNEGLTPIECTSNIDIQNIDEITASIRAVIGEFVRISIDDCLTNSLFLKTAKNLHYTKLIYSGILVMYHTKNQKKKNNNMETVINDTRHNVIATLCDHFKIDLENALKTCKTFSIENKNTNPLKPTVTLPFCGVVQQDWCQAIRINNNLFTQCNKPKCNNSDFCKTCNKHKSPPHGNINNRDEHHTKQKRHQLRQRYEETRYH